MNIGKILSELFRARMIAISALVLVLAPIILGGLAGFFLDRWLHTMPLFFLILLLCGLAAAVKAALKFKL